MAKSQGPGFFDMHIEKIIFLLCVVVMLFAVVYYGLSTPLLLEVPAGLGGQTTEVPPAEVDSTILESVKQIETVIQNAPAPVLPSRNDVPILKAQQIDFLQNSLFASVDFGSPRISGMVRMGIPFTESVPVTLDEVVKAMPAPAKPFNWTGIEIRTMETSTAENGQPSGVLVEEPVWRSVDWYSTRDLEKAWQKALKKTVIVPQIVALGYEVEFEELTGDGKWQPVTDVQPFRLPQATADTNQPQQPPVIPDYIEAADGTTNIQEVQQAIMELRNWMLESLQPEYYQIWSREGQIPWQRHMPLDQISALFGEKEKTTTAAPVRATTVTPTRGRTTRGMAVDPMMMPEMMPGMPTARGGRTYTPIASRTVATGEAGQEVSIPDINVQLEAGKLLSWFHANNLKFGKKYRCRFRWIFVNPLLTYTKSVKPENIQDATTIKTVASPWSPWSDTIAVSRKMDFFITGANDQRKEVTVTVFTEAMGQLVRARFNRIQAGQPIGGESEVSVLNPTSGEREKKILNFQTGAIAVELNFNRRFLTQFGRVNKNAVEMLYLDSNGILHSRILENDKISPKYRTMLEEAQAGEPEVERPVREEKPVTPRRTTRVTPTDMPPIPPDMPGMPGMPGSRKKR